MADGSDTPPPSSSPGAIDRRGLIAAIASISVAAMGFGHALPLLAILMDRYGASDGAIGVNTATMALAAVLTVPFFPRLIAKIGVKRWTLAALAVAAAAIFGFAIAGDDLLWWYPLRFLLGAAGSAVFAGSEVWITTLAPSAIRGRILGIYGTFLAIGFATGPLLVEAFGTTGLLPFAVGAGIFASALLPVGIAQPPAPARGETARGFLRLLPRAPASFLAAATFAGAEAALLTFIPVNGVEAGWTEGQAARAVTVYGLGLVAFQYLIGRQADRFGYARSLLVCAFVAAGAAAGFVLIGDQIVPSYGLLFVWGGFIAGIYTIGLAVIGDRFTGAERDAATVGYVFSYNMGLLVAPILAGLARQGFGQTGLEIFLAGFLAAYAVLIFRRRSAPVP